MYIVSRCLLGVNCKYNGGNSRCGEVIDFLRNKSFVSVCPETQGGLKAPRDPAEQQNGRVIDSAGRDLTEYFRAGAERALKLAMETAEAKGEPIEGAILKARSPSCGVTAIYDGTFTGATVPGDGIFAAELRKAGIPLMTEEDLYRSDK